MLESINLEETIAKVPDYPKPGILFYDISTLLMNTQAWTATVKRLADEISQYKPDIIAGIESRGFFTGKSRSNRISGWSSNDKETR